MGFFICIVSIYRLTIILSITPGSIDVTYNLKDFILWSIVELNIGVVCSCLPSMRPVLKYCSLHHLFSNRRSHDITSRYSSSHNRPKRDSRKSAIHRKGPIGGIVSSVTGLANIDEIEDDFHVTEGIGLHEQSKAKVETGPASSDTDIGSRIILSDGIGVIIQADQNISFNERQQPAMSC